MATITVWDDVGYQGQSHTFSSEQTDLSKVKKGVAGNWNDTICSFQIVEGYWQLYQDVGFGGLATQRFKAGDNIRSCPDAGFPNNWISSLKPVPPP